MKSVAAAAYAAVALAAQSAPISCASWQSSQSDGRKADVLTRRSSISRAAVDGRTPYSGRCHRA